jgi:4-amino-4-deoxychorismate lyase
LSTVPAWLNGAPADGALLLSRGLHYGDGVFRTLLKYDGQLVDLKLQVIKLCHDASVLGLDVDQEVLRSEAEAAGAAADRAVVKLMLLRAGAGRGYRSDSRQADRLALCYPLPEYPAAHWRQGIAAFRSGIKLGRQPVLAGIKHLNRLEQVLGSRDWPEGAGEGILCDEQLMPVCGTRSNLFWVRGGRLHTPSLENCGVAGVMRDKVLACAAALGVPVEVAGRPWHELSEADEAFVTNSLVGIWPLRSLEQRSWTAPGSLTRKLMTALRHPLINSAMR